jgi:hypothetical protein
VQSLKCCPHLSALPRHLAARIQVVVAVVVVVDSVVVAAGFGDVAVEGPTAAAAVAVAAPVDALQGRKMRTRGKIGTTKDYAERQRQTENTA